jgi:hypothetical protein
MGGVMDGDVAIGLKTSRLGGVDKGCVPDE